MNPQVSIVIPTYNRAKDLGCAIDSVRRQSWQSWELLVVDNYSSDNTEEVVRSYRDKRVNMLLAHNGGVVAVSRNLGIERATSDYIAFLDSDDWWAPDKLERSMAALDAGADIVYHDMYLAQSARTGRRFRRAVTRSLTLPVFESLLQHGNALVNSSVVVRRKLLMEVGGLSEDPLLASWEDYDCWLRLARITERFTRLKGVLGWYRWAGAGMSSPERTIRNVERIRDIYLRGYADDDLPGWLHYGMGRAQYHLQRHAEARRNMLRALRSSLPMGVKAKALLTLARSAMHRDA